MGIRLQAVVLGMTLVSAFSGIAGAAEGPVRLQLAGGWTARFFVEPLVRESAVAGEATARRSELALNARVTKPLGKRSVVSVEATNLFDREAPATHGALAPDAGRGLMIRFRKVF